MMNKMFALTGLDGNPPYLILKCDPERAIELIVELFYSVMIILAIRMHFRSTNTNLHYSRIFNCLKPDCHLWDVVQLIPPQ